MRTNPIDDVQEFIGGRDMKAGAVNVRLHHGGPPSAKPKAEIVADILASIEEQRA